MLDNPAVVKMLITDIVSFVLLSAGSNPHYLRDVILPWAHDQKNVGNNVVAKTLEKFTQRKTLVDESDELKFQLRDAWRKDDVFLSDRRTYLLKYVPHPPCRLVRNRSDP